MHFDILVLPEVEDDPGRYLSLVAGLDSVGQAEKLLHSLELIYSHPLNQFTTSGT